MREPPRADDDAADDDRPCCFVCAYSTTNPALLFSDTPEWFQPRARPDGVVGCKRFCSTMLTMGNNSCAAYLHRDHFAGWPPLPPSIHPADRYRDDPNYYRMLGATMRTTLQAVAARRTP
jgi:hypothetical protein